MSHKPLLIIIVVLSIMVTNLIIAVGHKPSFNQKTAQGSNIIAPIKLNKN